MPNFDAKPCPGPLRTGLMLLLPAVLLLSCNRIEPVEDFDGTFTDPRDSAVYPYVRIGSQVWMATNLNYRPAGDKGAWCYNGAEGNCETYGRLYNWSAALKACPPGWHLPTDGEWKQLEIEAGMDTGEADSLEWRNSGAIGIALKARKGWNSGGNGENTLRFGAIPSGIYEDAGYHYIGDLATFWTATGTDETHAWGRALIYYEAGAYRWRYGSAGGYSVRCIRNP